MLSTPTNVQGHNIKAQCSVVSGTAKVAWSGVMGLSIQVDGSMALPRAMGHFIMQMAMSMRATGSIANVTDTGYISIRKVRGMKASGRMIPSGAEGLRPGLKEVDMKASMFLVKSRDMALICGLINQLTKENGSIIRFMGLVNISGQMAENIGDIGVRMICMELEFIFTLME